MSTELGKQAEKAAAEFLARKYDIKIRSMNWRNRYCEIDIVGEKKEGLLKKTKTIHFIEVKYRSNSAQGGGFEYITERKFTQMLKAAEIWVYENDWTGDYQLDAVAVSGSQDGWQFDYRPDLTYR